LNGDLRAVIQLFLSLDPNIQRDILRLLDKAVKTGVPVEIERKGKRLLISPAEKR
jgi:hypothetical protein